MAFKTLESYNEERFSNLFLLRNDGDYADVVFLYRNFKDVLVASVHYVKSAEYSGYVHCCGVGCPACARGIRTQSKIFIPMYNITEDAVQFWDRSTRFELQLENDVFRNCPNPSEYVFRITRRGSARDINTSYTIVPISKNTSFSYDTILTKKGITLPAYYDVICKDYPVAELSMLLNENSSNTSGYSSGITELPDYPVIPRNSTTYVDVPTATTTPDTLSALPNFENAPTNINIDPLDEDDVDF